MKFTDALHHVLKREGGYSHDPADPGGETNYGITLRVYEGWRADHKLPLRSVKLITPDEIASIYDTRYWDAVQGDTLNNGYDANVALQVFDFAVNAGPKQAILSLQRILGVKEDGQLGPQTLGALIAKPPAEIRVLYADERERFYRSLVARRPALQKFLAGWLKRVAIIRDAV